MKTQKFAAGWILVLALFLLHCQPSDREDALAKKQVTQQKPLPPDCPGTALDQGQFAYPYSNFYDLSGEKLDPEALKKKFYRLSEAEIKNLAIHKISTYLSSPGYYLHTYLMKTPDYEALSILRLGEGGWILDLVTYDCKGRFIDSEPLSWTIGDEGLQYQARSTLDNKGHITRRSVEIDIAEPAEGRINSEVKHFLIQPDGKIVPRQ